MLNSCCCVLTMTMMMSHRNFDNLPVHIGDWRVSPPPAADGVTSACCLVTLLSCYNVTRSPWLLFSYRVSLVGAVTCVLAGAGLVVTWRCERLPHCQLMAQVSSELPRPAPWALSWSPLTLSLHTGHCGHCTCHSLVINRCPEIYIQRFGLDIFW